jgi:hypothetical protein
LLEAIQTGEPRFQRIFGMTPWEHRQRNPELGALFNIGLREQTIRVADSVLRAYNFAGAREIADIGGGHGGLLSVILLAHPHLRGVLVDLPHVVDYARATLEKCGFIERCQMHGTDFFNAVPPGSDIYLLKSVLHDWDDTLSQRILCNCRRAMAPSSRLLIIERTLRDRGEQDSATAMLDLHMLVMYGGRERSLAGYRRLASAADLEVQQILPTDAGFHIIELLPRETTGRRA